MTGTWIALLCSFQLIVPAQAQEPQEPVPQQVSKLTKGDFVEVTLRNGGKLRGHLISAGETSFALKESKRTVLSKNPAPANVSYDDVQSVRKRMSPLAKKLLTSVVVGGALVVVIAITASKVGGV